MRPARVIPIALTALALALPAGASAAAPELLWQVPEDGTTGTSAGRLSLPFGLAASPTDGHVFVGELGNARISEFDVWGEFVKAWGWDVAPDGAPGDTVGDQLEACTTICQAGVAGSGVGQLDEPVGLEVGSDGSVYVYEYVSLRIQKFDPAGNFVWMAGGGVDQGPNHPGNLCTAAYVAEGDVCGAGTVGGGEGEFSTGALDDYLAFGPEEHLFVGDVERIQELTTDGEYAAEVSVAGKTIRSLDIDAAGNFYATYADEINPYTRETNVYKLSPSGASLQPTFPVTANFYNPRTPIALDAAGSLYVQDDPIGLSPGERPHVVAFEPDGTKILPTEEEEEAGSYFAEAEKDMNGLATNSGNACGIPGTDIYVAYFSASLNDNESAIRAYGPPPNPEVCPPPPAAPTITAQYAVSASPDGALLKANINPRFWFDTSYYVEYGTGECAEGGCPDKQPLSPAELDAGGVNTPVQTKGVFLPGLSPQTTYRFRFVAQSSGGGPAYGIDPDGEGLKEATAEDGLEGTFTTPAVPSPLLEPDPCPNASLRSGLSAFLPDCRAYEMVSPVDKDNGDIVALLTANNHRAGLNQAAAAGGTLGYSTYRAFGDAQSSPYTSQYMASRSPSGWLSHGISPPRGISILGNFSYDTEYQAFTEDLCSGWLLHDTDPVLASGAVEGFANVYRREEARGGCAAAEDGYEALTTVPPPNLAEEPNKYLPDLQGISADGSVAAFRVNDRLTGNAAAGTNFQCYEASGGKLRLISVLPSGLANGTQCSVGTGISLVVLRNASVDHAVSEDGSRIYWSATESPTGEGRIYLRKNGKNPTIAVSAQGEGISGAANASSFLTAAADGSRAIYLVADPSKGIADLYEFDAESQTSTPIAKQVSGILGASDDATRVYLVSEEGLDGASAGQPNLYLYEAGEGGGFSFIGALAEDRSGALYPLSPTALEPIYHTARVSPDGMHAVFMSNAGPTGYDNIDANSGRPDAEVYRYDAGAKELSCVSCNPTGARPSGRELEIQVEESGLWAAAQIPPWTTQLYASRVLSEDGSRLFFESYEALVGRDTNQKQDVYQWEQPGSGTCSEAAPAYSPPNGGCISLISSGKSPADVRFIDASADGADVFFATGASLVAQDPGLIDVYDARVEGGFPPPDSPKEICQGEACQSPAAAPESPTPATLARRAGNPGRASGPRCPKGRRAVRQKGRTRCLKRPKAKKGAGRKRAGQRRAGR